MLRAGTYRDPPHLLALIHRCSITQGKTRDGLTLQHVMLKGMGVNEVHWDKGVDDFMHNVLNRESSSWCRD